MTTYRDEYLIVADKSLATIQKLRFGWQSINAVIGGMARAYAKQEQAEENLRRVLEANNKLTAESFQRHKDMASALQLSARVIGDEVILQLDAMAISMGVAENRTDDVIRAAIGMQKVFGVAAPTALRALAAAMGGSNAMLTRYIGKQAATSTSTEDLIKKFAALSTSTGTSSEMFASLNNLVGDAGEKLIELGVGAFSGGEGLAGLERILIRVNDALEAAVEHADKLGVAIRTSLAVSSFGLTELFTASNVESALGKSKALAQFREFLTLLRGEDAEAPPDTPAKPAKQPPVKRPGSQREAAEGFPGREAETFEKMRVAEDEAERALSAAHEARVTAANEYHALQVRELDALQALHRQTLENEKADFAKAKAAKVAAKEANVRSQIEAEGLQAMQSLLGTTITTMVQAAKSGEDFGDALIAALGNQLIAMGTQWLIAAPVHALTPLLQPLAAAEFVGGAAALAVGAGMVAAHGGSVSTPSRGGGGGVGGGAGVFASRPDFSSFGGAPSAGGGETVVYNLYGGLGLLTERNVEEATTRSRQRPQLGARRGVQRGAFG